MSTIPQNVVSDSIDQDIAPVMGTVRKKWSRQEYHQLGEQGWFRDQRVELFAGEIIVLSPQSFGHAYAVDEIGRILLDIFGPGYWVRTQLPLDGGPGSEPEPDVSVYHGEKTGLTDHPGTSVLVVEVSQSTLEYDKGPKANLYASMDIPDYWVLDVNARCLLVHREPIVDNNQPFAHRYRHVQTIDSEGQATPLEKPNAIVPIAAMLMPAE